MASSFKSIVAALLASCAGLLAQSSSTLMVDRTTAIPSSHTNLFKSNVVANTQMGINPEIFGKVSVTGKVGLITAQTEEVSPNAGTDYGLIATGAGGLRKVLLNNWPGSGSDTVQTNSSLQHTNHGTPTNFVHDSVPNQVWDFYDDFNRPNTADGDVGVSSPSGHPYWLSGIGFQYATNVGKIVNGRFVTGVMPANGTNGNIYLQTRFFNPPTRMEATMVQEAGNGGTAIGGTTMASGRLPNFNWMVHLRCNRDSLTMEITTNGVGNLFPVGYIPWIRAMTNGEHTAFGMVFHGNNFAEIYGRGTNLLIYHPSIDLARGTNLYYQIGHTLTNMATEAQFESIRAGSGGTAHYVGYDTNDFWVPTNGVGLGYSPPVVQLHTNAILSRTEDESPGTNQMILVVDPDVAGFRKVAIGNLPGGTGSGTPGGATTQFQFNNGGSFDGATNFTWDLDANIARLIAGASLYFDNGTTTNMINHNTIGPITSANFNIQQAGGAVMRADTSGNWLPLNGPRDLGSTARYWDESYVSNSVVGKLLTINGGLEIPPQLLTSTIDVTTNIVFTNVLSGNTTITIAGLTPSYEGTIWVVQDSDGAHTLTVTTFGEVFCLNTNAGGITMLKINGYLGTTNVSCDTPGVYLTGYIQKGDVLAADGTNLVAVTGGTQGQMLMRTNANHVGGVAWVDAPSGGSGSAFSLTNVTAVSTNFHINTGVAATDYSITLTGNSGITITTDADDGKPILVRIIQDSSGNRSVVWTNMFTGSLDALSVPPNVNTNANAVGYYRFKYYSANSQWHFIGEGPGYGL